MVIKCFLNASFDLWRSSLVRKFYSVKGAFRNFILIQKAMCITMFIAVLSAIAKGMEITQMSY